MHRQVSLMFARQTLESSDLIGILFVMKIDPSITPTPFANIRDASCYKREEKTIFSMHSIFRIGPIEQIGGNNCLWQVDLTLTSENDSDLHALTKHMRQNTYSDKEGWDGLGMLLIKLGRIDNVQEVYDVLID
ncbi:unnamed protein product [Rotaria sp. Silwood1]|nr:unnamed protein product [Rotaria sp. Silwood1]